jgi:hypothetical protein
MSARPWFAYGAQALLQARQQGLKPDDIVTVAMDGRAHPEPLIRVRPDAPVDRLEWRMLVNVNVELWTDPSVSFDRTAQTAFRIAQVRPRNLTLVFDDGEQRHTIDCGQGWHTPAVADVPAQHWFLWQPITLNTSTARRIARALKQQHREAIL